MNEKRVSKVDDFIWRRIGDEVVVVKDGTLSVHVLNKTAAHIWEMCAGDLSVKAVAASLCERFEVPFEDAVADVEDIVGKLEQMGLLKLVDVDEVSC